MSLGQKSGQTAGIISSIAAYILWGIFPIYWKMVQQVPAHEILAHRIVWCFVFMVLVIYATKRTASIMTAVRGILADKKRTIDLFICSGLITINWLTYIWAVNDNRIIETSFGYYINPLISVLLAIVVLNERLSFWHTVSLLLATVGVVNMIFQLGTLPWVSLVLAVSFGLYGLYKKIVNLGAITAITLETLILTPAALCYLLFLEHQGIGSLFSVSPAVTLLLVCAGAVTAIPLLLFSHGASRLPLTIVGFIQFFSPTMTLLVGVFLYNENFTPAHLISFSFIWLALVVFSLAPTAPFTKLESILVGMLFKSSPPPFPPPKPPESSELIK